MKWFLLLLALPLQAQQQQAAPVETPQEYPIISHNNGLSTFYSPNRLEKDQSPKILNGYLDADMGVVKRNGYQLYGNLPGCTGRVHGGWPYTNLNGTFYFFVFCTSNGRLYKTIGDGNFNTFGPTLSVINPLQATKTLGYEWFSNGIDQVFSTDGVSIFPSTAAPRGQLIGTFQSRVALANVPGFQSSVFLSGYLNGNDYTLPAIAVDTNSVQFPLNGQNDTRKVTCMFDGFKDVLILWNETQTWGLYGSGQATFVLRLLSNEVGCLEQGTVQEQDGRLIWLSKRGMEDFDGTSINVISWPIQDQVRTIASTQQKIVTLQQSGNSFLLGNTTAAGAGFPVSVTISPGSVVASTWGASIVYPGGLSDQFYTGISSISIPGYLTLSQASTATFYNAGGEAGNLTTNWNQNNYTPIVTGLYRTRGFAGADGRFGQGGTVGYIRTWILDTSSNVVLTGPVMTNTAPSAPAQEYFINTSNLAQQMVKIQLEFHCDNGGTFILENNAISVPFIRPSGIKIKVAHTNLIGNGSSCDMGWAIWETSGPVNGSLASQVFDTGFKYPIWGPFVTPISSSPQGTLTLNSSVSSSTFGVFDSSVTLTPGANVASASKEFLQYYATWSANSSTNTPATLGSNSLTATDTGTFISQCFNPGVPVVAWGAFQANVISNGGSIAFFVSTGTSCGAVQGVNANWVAQNNNALISISTAAFLGVKAMFSLTATTQAPALTSLSISFQNVQGRPAAVSTVYLRRYYLAYSTNTSPSAFNDSVLVYDMRQKWTKLDDIFASALWNYNLNMYSGSSLMDGNVFLQDTGLTDNGNLFTFTFQTPDLELNNFSLFKHFDDMYLEGKGTLDPTLAGSLDINYYVDGGTRPFALGSISTLESERNYFYLRNYFPLNSAYPTRGHTLKLEYKNTSLSPLTIYESLIRYWVEPLP